MYADSEMLGLICTIKRNLAENSTIESPDWNSSTINGWNGLKFGANLHVRLTLNSDPLFIFFFQKSLFFQFNYKNWTQFGAKRELENVSTELATLIKEVSFIPA